MQPSLPTGAVVDAPLSDLLETVGPAATVRLDALNTASGWGFFAAVSLWSIGSDDTTRQGDVQQADLRQSAFEIGATRRFNRASGPVDIYVGVRRWSTELDAEIDPVLTQSGRSRIPGETNLEFSADWYDPIVGARIRRPVGDRWTFVGTGDIGGFGAGSDFTWRLTLAYEFSTDPFGVQFGYDALGIDYSEGAEYEIGYFSQRSVTHGPFAGLRFEF